MTPEQPRNIMLRKNADRLQKQGKTLSEIAETLDCRRAYICQILYWEKVRWKDEL